MVATISPRTTAKYLIGQTKNYYLGGGEPHGHWIAVGISENDVSLGGIVQDEIFERLHAGRDADGKALLQGAGKNHVGGFDVTFSPPKDFSVLWAMADDESRAKLEAAHEMAVLAGIHTLEEFASFCRSGKDGKFHEKALLTVAAFPHGEARPVEHEDGRVYADPQFHTHAFILNLAQKSCWPSNVPQYGALDGRALFKWKMASGAAYHVELAKQLELLGFAVGEVGKNGIFDIQGIDTKLKSLFSSRRKLIDKKLDAAGTDSVSSPALAAAITKATRNSKLAHEAEDRFALWRERAAEIGFEAEAIVNACVNAGTAGSVLEGEREKPIAERMAAISRTLTEHQATFEHRELYEAVASALVGTGAGSERIELELGKLVAAQAVIALDDDVWGHPIYSTPEIIKTEREICALTLSLAKEKGQGVKRQFVEALIEKHRLNGEQAEAARAAFATDSLTLIEGAPGTGKTTTAKVIVEGWQAQGYEVIATAPRAKTAKMLKQELGIEARSIAWWLTRANNGGSFIGKKTVLIVDEAALASSLQLQAILEAIESATVAGGAPRLVLLGDRNQLESVGPPGLPLIADALLVHKVETIVRQKEPWLKDAISAFGNGQAKEALEAFASRGLVHEANGPAATIKLLVDHWELDQAENPGSNALLLAKTNAQVHALNLEVRCRERAKGILVGEDISIEAVNRSGYTVALPLAQGDRVRFLARAKLSEGDVINGTEGTVERIDTSKSGALEFTVQTDAGRFTFTPDQIADDKGRAQITHAAASTIAISQGLTSDKTFILAGSELDRRDIYVAASRARENTKFFIDQKAVDAEIAAEQPMPARTHVSDIDKQARHDHLSKRWARRSLKLTALEVLAAANERKNAPNKGDKVSSSQTANMIAAAWAEDFGLE